MKRELILEAPSIVLGLLIVIYGVPIIGWLILVTSVTHVARGYYKV